jgi:hypothetical protein
MEFTKNVRKYERATFLCQVSMSAGGGAAIQTSSVDISLGGVGLISPVLVQMGQAVTLAFHLKNSAHVPIVEGVQGRVVFIRSEVDGHRLGVEFYEPLHRSRNPHLTRKVESL